MKRLIYLFICTVTTFTAQAQLLWKVSGNNLKKPSYIFGTHHLIPASYLDSIPGVYKCFNSCDVIVGEIIINSVDAGDAILKKALLPKDKTIRDFVTDEEYKLIDNELSNVLKIKLSKLSTLKPYYLLMMYELEFYKNVMKSKDEIQIDSYFQLVANDKNKKVVGLETIDKQLELLYDSIDLNRQVQMLVETIRNKDINQKDVLLLEKLYKAGDLDGLFALSGKENNISDFNPAEYRMLVDDRNANWINQLPLLMKKNSCFIAVGAMHLAGDKGILQLLRKAGYVVKPVEESKNKKLKK